MGKLSKANASYRFILWLKKHSDKIQCLFGIVEGLFGGLYFDTLSGFNYEAFKESEVSLLFFVLIAIFLQIALISVPSKLLMKSKAQIINNLLSSCRRMLFTSCSFDDWEVCSMVQVPKNGKRRTPYYENEACNTAIRNHRSVDFGDVGQEFFSKEIHQSYLPISISYSKWLSESEEYREDVPENLRAIFAAAIYSPAEEDSKTVIAVLEFDVFAKKEQAEMPQDIFKKIDTIENRNALCDWAKSMAHLLEEI